MDIDDHTLIISDWLDPILLSWRNNVITYNNGMEIYNERKYNWNSYLQSRYTNESKKCYVDIPIDALPTLDAYLQIYVFKWSMWSPNLSKAIKYALLSKEEKRSTYDADFEL